MEDYTSTQSLERGEFVERCRMGGQDLVRSVHVPVTHVRWSRRGAMRAYVVATGLLRVFVKVLYLFPLLLVAKVVLWVMNIGAGDLITVVFVQLVVAVFALLVIVLFLFLLVGPRSERSRHGALAFHPPAPHEVERILSRAGGTRIIGRVDAGLDLGASVLRETWEAREENLARRFTGSGFVVFTDDGGAVAVELAACPTLLGPYDEGEVTVRQGDRVEIVAADVRDAPHADDARLGEIIRNREGGLAPYRGAEAMLRIVSSTPDAPLLVRRL